MKLALIRQRYTPFGGAERFMDRAIQALGQQAEITVFAREWRGEAAGYRFVECNPSHRSNVQRERGFAEAVRMALRAETFDLVQSHERMVPAGIGAPFIYRAGDGVHATWLRERARAQGALGSLRNAINPYHRFMVALEHDMFTHANLAGVICNSRMVRDDIAARFAVPAAELHVIHNGVDLDRFSPRLRDTLSNGDSAHIAETPGGSGFQQNVPLLLYVGSGFERKGVKNLLTAFARAKGKATLAIVGEDKQAKRYQRLAARLGIDPGAAQTLHDAAHAVCVAPALSHFFDPAQFVRARNEMTYANAQGEVRRVDRVVECASEVWVLDYKSQVSDAERTVYAAQVAGYVNALRCLYPHKIMRGALIDMRTRTLLVL